MPRSRNKHDPYPGPYEIRFHERVVEAWSPEYRAEYAKKVAGIVDSSAKMETKALKGTVEVLQRTRREIIDVLADTPEDRFAAFQLGELKRSIDEKLDVMESELAQAITGQIDEMGALGADGTSELLGMMGIEVPKADVSAALAASVRDFSTDLVTNLTNEARSKITNVVNRAALSGQSLTKTMHEIGTNLVDPSVFKSIAARAEAIARTETLRIRAMASQSRMEQAAELVPGLKKQWIAVIDTRTRATHISADRRYRPGGETGPIKVDQMYRVGTDQMKFPRDPAGSAKETVNCRCISTPFVEDAEERAEQAAAPGFDQDAEMKRSREEALRESERSSRHLKNERGTIMTENGRVLTVRDGDAGSITWEQEDMEKSVGSWMTHNHPKGRSFSNDDISNLMEWNQREIRAVTPDGKVFRMINKKYIPDIAMDPASAATLGPTPNGAMGRWKKFSKWGEDRKLIVDKTMKELMGQGKSKDDAFTEASRRSWGILLDENEEAAEWLEYIVENL